jgi:hypothetical protein
MRKDGIAPGLRLHIGGVGSFSLFYKIDRIPSFDIRYSTFCGSTVRCLYPSFDILRFYGSLFISYFSLTLSTYAPVRVSIFNSSPSSINGGTWIT